MFLNKVLILICCLLSLSTMILARTTNNHQYHSVINRRSSAPSLQNPTTGLSSNGISAATSNNKDTNENLDSVSSFSNVRNENSFWNDFSLFYKVYRQCAKDDLSVCLKIKLLAGLEKASRSIKEFNLISGIKFIRDDSAQENLESPMSENEIISNLPRSLEARDESLNNMILSKIQSFVKSHTLQIKFDDNDEVEERSSEARKKKKGNNGALIMLPLLFGGTIVPIAYGALALLAGKALIVSKLALVLASIIGIKKLLSGGGHKESEVVVSGGHSSGWGRDLDLAYSAYAPKDSSKTK